MTGVIELWQRDHVKYSRLLDLLSSELAEFESEGSPDYELMLEVMHYMTDYSDRTHHVQEDHTYARLAEFDSNAAPVVDDLREQHRIIAVSGARLVTGLNAIVNGTLVPRASIQTQATTYVGYLRNHMRLEESELFPILIANPECLPETLTFSEADDPLFGTQVTGRYEDLRKSLGSTD